MATDFSFSLSLAALDLVWEQLRLGSLPMTFEVPSVGDTLEDRARLREVVFRDLNSRNLAERGRLLPAAEEALITLGRFRHAVDGVGKLADDEILCSRAATDGRLAVLASKRDLTVQFEVFRPENLVSVVMDQIGTQPPGPGHSVTFPENTEPVDPGTSAGAHRKLDPEEGFAGVFQPVRPPSTPHQLQQRAAMNITDRPRTQIGWFTVIGRDQRGRENRLPQIVWFDTEEGRYLSYRRPGQDGQIWSTYTPADSNRIAQQLIGQLNSLNPR